MPGIIIWVTFPEGMHARLLQTNRCGFTVIGSAPKFSNSALGGACGPGSIFVRISIFPQHQGIKEQGFLRSAQVC